jgi:serine/threonine-protein kinase HipA
VARPTHPKSLFIWMNGELVGTWSHRANRPQQLTYANQWLASTRARPLSLSMPLGPIGTIYRGSLVERYFENLLPDSKTIRQRLRQRFAAKSDGAFDLLTEIGRDCVGAIQLTIENEAPKNVRKIDGAPLNDAAIAELLRNTTSATALGHDVHEDEFRISLAGAQEKTALLRSDSKWFRPLGATPTTHILKLPIGEGNRGTDLTRSVENEWLCSQILSAFGIATAKCWMDQFEEQRVLVVERFDRRLADNRRWIMRLPQEDLAQATGTEREQKYEADGGPGIEQIMTLLLGSAKSDADRLDFFRTQILFWCLCAIDGHAKNFSIFLAPQGRYHLTPRYDVLSAFPVLGKKAGQLSPHKIKMAMSVPSEKRKHYNWDSIVFRHWQHLAKRCGVAGQFDSLVAELRAATPEIIARVGALLPKGFPSSVADPILEGLLASTKKLALA